MSDRLVVGGVQVPTGTLNGVVNGAKGLTGFLTQKAELVGNLATAYAIGATTYTGEYEVTPTVEGLGLQTKHKYMTDDVTVRAIPFFEVSNTGGGTTVYIADEIEME